MQTVHPCNGKSGLPCKKLFGVDLKWSGREIQKYARVVVGMALNSVNG